MIAKEKVLVELDCILKDYQDTSGQPGFGFAPETLAECNRIITLLAAAINRHAPSRSEYVRQLEMSMTYDKRFDAMASRLAGILQALRADYASDRIRTFQELVHTDLFADLLEAADYLLGETYKDPAAVMAGGVLEQHLRELCRKHSIDTTFTTPGGGTKPKMIDTMNADLAKASAYGKIDQKQVTAWAGIRNAAAHGHYDEYDDNQVRQMIAGIRGFISKYPG